MDEPVPSNKELVDGTVPSNSTILLKLYMNMVSFFLLTTYLLITVKTTLANKTGEKKLILY